MILEKTFPSAARAIRKHAVDARVTSVARGVVRCRLYFASPPASPPLAPPSTVLRVVTARSTLLAPCVGPSRFELGPLGPFVSHLSVRFRP